jgi:N-acetylglucosamine kinase-like BadF-type ATPase
MAKKSFVRKTQRTIVGAAKSGAARVQKIAIKAATAAATAAAEAAVEEVMKTMRDEGQARGQSTAVKKPVRRTKPKQAGKRSQRKRR